MNAEELKVHNKATFHRLELSKVKAISFAELDAVFNKWMLIPDTGIVKLLCAFYCANKLSRKAVWLIIIAASGGGKTEFLNSLLDLADIEPISILTPNTFLSGMPGPKDASLLPRLTGRIMLFKDWTTVLSMQKDARADIFSQFREIWDGSMKKIFGNGKVREWTGKVSLLAASTQAVDMNQQQLTHLGERFINYRPLMPDRKEVAMRSLDNDSDSDVMATELRIAMFSFIKGMDFETKTEKLPFEVKRELVDLANFCTMARSGVIRDFGMKKEVMFVPASEMPTRIAQQLNALGAGFAVVNGGKFLEEDMRILYKCALDSIPQTNKMVIVEMAKADQQSTVEIATALGYPTEPIRMYLENLALLRVCKRTKESGKSDRWTLEPEFANIIRNYEGVIELTGEERSARKSASEDSNDTAVADAWDKM